jgi:hypothetical protein
VYQALDIAMAQPMDVVWWQLSQHTGKEMSLAATREWAAQREPPAREAVVEDEETVELERIPE